MRIIIVTGLSGAGKSEALRSFEDMGYFCVDNLPPGLIPTFLDLCTQQMDADQNVALVVDCRGGDFFHDIYQVLYHLKDAGHTLSLIHI